MVMLLLPIDWFYPTGMLFREGGAKPDIPLLVCGSVLILLLKPTYFLHMNIIVYQTGLLLIGIFMLGSVAFWINCLFTWSGYEYAKNPITQFITQSTLFFLFTMAVVTHANLLRFLEWRMFLLKTIPVVVIIHMSIFFLEYWQLLSVGHGPLSLFRTITTYERPSGLMSEPSYFGAFVGMYGTVLVLIRSVPQYKLRCILGILLFVCAVLTDAKTFIPVSVCALAVAVWQHPKSLLRIRYVPIAIVFLAVCSYVIVSRSALDVQENYSSAMRLGSSVLALNVARHGYAVTGIGFGQFHFFYKPSFAPSFLVATNESSIQFSSSIEYRASTFNYYVRLLLETGLVGLIMLLYMLYRIMRAARYDFRPESLLGMLLLAGSLGFLFTQDTYFYPPLVIGLALVLGSIADPIAHHRFADRISFKLLCADR